MLSLSCNAMPMMLDYHTHNLSAPPGSAIVNLPLEALLNPAGFDPVPGGYYSLGIHPWWTDQPLSDLWRGMEVWLGHPQVVVIGECGLDKLRGAALVVQEEVFLRHVRLSETLGLPLTIHCVKAFDRILALHRQLAPVQRWTIHGFRGKPALAQQLLTAGFNLSFGVRFNVESWQLTPADRRYRETDDEVVPDWNAICPKSEI